MAGAFAATADDPSAIFYNVAGLAQSRKLGAMAGATIIMFDAEFEGDQESYPFGVTETFEDHIFTPPNMYMTIPIGENATFGVGQFTAFGLRTDWANPNTYSGRFISQDANLKTASIQPSFAMKMFNDRFMWGVGLEYRTSHVSLERNQAAINPFNQRITDIAHVRLDSEWSDDWGYNVGVIFKPVENWSVGLSYRSTMSIDYDGDADFTQIRSGNQVFDAIVASQLPADQDIELTIDYPAWIHFGVATTAIENWQIEVDIVEQTWSEFKELEVDFENANTPDLFVEQNWKDTRSYRLGANRSLGDNWHIRLGYVYDENPQPTEVVGPLLPDADRSGASFGVGYVGEHWRVELSDLFLHFFDRSTRGRNQDNFNGRYENTANLIGVQFGYSF